MLVLKRAWVNQTDAKYDCNQIEASLVTMSALSRYLDAGQNLKYGNLDGLL